MGGERIDGESSWFALDGPNIWAAWAHMGFLSVEEDGSQQVWLLRLTNAWSLRRW